MSSIVLCGQIFYLSVSQPQCFVMFFCPSCLLIQVIRYQQGVWNWTALFGLFALYVMALPHHPLHHQSYAYSLTCPNASCYALLSRDWVQWPEGMFITEVFFFFFFLEHYISIAKKQEITLFVLIAILYL